MTENRITRVIAMQGCSHRYGWYGFHRTTFHETKSRVYVTVLCIDVIRSRHSRGIYNCGGTPPSVYVYLERKASTITRFPICSSSCSFTPEIASETISESLESKNSLGEHAPRPPSEHAPHATIIHSVYC